MNPSAYDLPSPTHWIVLGVQGSQYNTAEAAKFTLNCQVVRRDTWDEARRERPYLGPKPNPNTIAGTFVWESRIGSLMPAGQDTWWRIHPSDDPGVIAEEVATAVRQYVLPAIQRAVQAADAGPT